MIPLKDDVQARDVPVITWTIIFLNTLVFFFEVTSRPEFVERLAYEFGMVPARIGADSSSYWTLVTCMFLHGGWLHFIGNMWTLYIFGDNVEDRMGPARFLVFYLLCGIGASLVHYWADPTSQLPTIGASGAIAGVLGAYFVMFPAAKVITLVPILFVPLFFNIPAYVFLGVWFLSQVVSGTLSIAGGQQLGGVAWWAHVGGFVAGIVLRQLFAKPQKEIRRVYPDEYWPW